MNIIKALKVLDRNWHRMVPEELADRITGLMQQAVTMQEERAVQKRCFRFAFGSVDTFQGAKRRMLRVAKRVLTQNSLAPLQELGPSLVNRITRRGA